MSDEWLREHASKGKAADERSIAVSAEGAEREARRKEAFTRQLPDLLDELISELERKAALYNEIRGRRMLLVNVERAGSQAAGVTVEGKGVRRRITYEIRVDLTHGTLTSYERYSDLDGRESGEGVASLLAAYSHSLDLATFSTQVAGPIPPSAAADAVLQRVLAAVS